MLCSPCSILFSHWLTAPYKHLILANSTKRHGCATDTYCKVQGLNPSKLLKKGAALLTKVRFDSIVACSKWAGTHSSSCSENSDVNPFKQTWQRRQRAKPVAMTHNPTAHTQQQCVWCVDVAASTESETSGSSSRRDRFPAKLDITDGKNAEQPVHRERGTRL